MREKLIKRIEEILDRKDHEELKSTLAISVIDLFIESIDEMIKDEVDHINKALSNEDNQPNIRQASLCYEAMAAYAGIKNSLAEPKEETI
jgi:hypothetical protein